MDDVTPMTLQMKDMIKRDTAKALIDLDTYTVMVTSHPYASHDYIQQAITASRTVQDRISEIKSDALRAIDAIKK